VSVCKNAKFLCALPEESTTLTLHPTYSECTVELAGTHAAKVNTEGCNLQFAAGPPETAEGTVSIVCEEGKTIKVEVTSGPARRCLPRGPMPRCAGKRGRMPAGF
jgi:hypothetical protein